MSPTSDGPSRTADEPDARWADLAADDRHFCAALDELSNHPDPAARTPEDLEDLYVALTDSAPGHLTEEMSVWVAHMRLITEASTPFIDTEPSAEEFDAALAELPANTQEFVAALSFAARTGSLPRDGATDPVMFHQALVCVEGMQPDEVPDWWLVRLFLSDGSDGAFPLSLEESMCIADDVARSWGPDRLAALDLPDADDVDDLELTDSELTVSFDAFETCVDQVGRLAELLAADPDVAHRTARSVAERYVDSGLLRKSMLSAGFDADLNARIDEMLDDAFIACS